MSNSQYIPQEKVKTIRIYVEIALFQAQITVIQAAGFGHNLNNERYLVDGALALLNVTHARQQGLVTAAAVGRPFPYDFR